MRDIPVFCTELGVASLVLKKIPYTKEAYIHIQDSSDVEVFLKECTDFCKAVGAEGVYATGIDDSFGYTHHTTLIKMCCSRESLHNTSAMLFPVQKKTLETFREIYNRKMARVPNASYMSSLDAKKLAEHGGAYFIHEDNVLLGIGIIDGDNIDAIASVKPGRGEDVLLALCSAIAGTVITLTVANNNRPAVKLYDRLGFIPVEELERWYKIL